MRWIYTEGNTTMNVIEITRSERKTGTLQSKNLKEAVRAVQDEGYVVLNDVIDHEHINEIQSKMLDDVPAIMAMPEPPYQFTRGHIQHDPPPFDPYLFRDVVCNDIVVTITHMILGDGVRNTFYSGNTNLPGSVRQPVHVDQGHLWPGQEQAHPASMLVVNVPVVDMTAHNGSIELWPESHLDPTVCRGDSIRVPEAKVRERMSIHKPFQPEILLGGVLIRDMRLWHRGVPNHSDTPRPMIAMIHVCPWMRSGQITAKTGTEHYFEHRLLETSANYVEGPINYLTGHKSYDPRPEEFEAGAPF